jgi:hypothetical protein
MYHQIARRFLVTTNRVLDRMLTAKTICQIDSLLTVFLWKRFWNWVNLPLTGSVGRCCNQPNDVADVFE